MSGPRETNPYAERLKAEIAADIERGIAKAEAEQLAVAAKHAELLARQITVQTRELNSLRTQLAEAVALLQDVPEQPKDHEGYSPGWYWNIRTFIAAYDAVQS